MFRHAEVKNICGAALIISEAVMEKHFLVISGDERLTV